MHNLYKLVFIFYTISNVVVIQAQESDQKGSETTPSGEGAVSLPANSPLEGLFPRFRGRALVMDINAQIVEQNQTVIWNESHRTTTIPGRPVGIKLVGSNLVVAIQFTPYIRGVQKLLVAQGQIWMDIPNQGIRYHTSMQTIPLEFNEPIYFFPLGPQRDEGTACIEVMLTLHPYEEE
jgi:hypothetical protein